MFRMRFEYAFNLMNLQAICQERLYLKEAEIVSGNHRNSY